MLNVVARSRVVPPAPWSHAAQNRSLNYVLLVSLKVRVSLITPICVREPEKCNAHSRDSKSTTWRALRIETYLFFLFPFPVIHGKTSVFGGSCVWESSLKISLHPGVVSGTYVLIWEKRQLSRSAPWNLVVYVVRCPSEFSFWSSQLSVCCACVSRSSDSHTTMLLLLSCSSVEGYRFLGQSEIFLLRVNYAALVRKPAGKPYSAHKCRFSLSAKACSHPSLIDLSRSYQDVKKQQRQAPCYFRRVPFFLYLKNPERVEE